MAIRDCEISTFCHEDLIAFLRIPSVSCGLENGCVSRQNHLASVETCVLVLPANRACSKTEKPFDLSLFQKVTDLLF